MRDRLRRTDGLRRTDRLRRGPLLVALVVPLLIAVPAVWNPGRASASSRENPFYIAPSATKECNNLAYCFGIRGPWVVVPATGEATFLMSCPVRAKIRDAFIIGGTDALTSSGKISVWFDGKLGAPIGSPAGTNYGLLFHAISNDGQRGTFQPILGCINLRQASKRSTVSVSATPNAPHGAPPPRPRAKLLVLEPGWDRTFSTSCLKSETLVGSWSSYAFGTLGPPPLPSPGAVRIRTVERGRTVTAVVHTDSSVPYLIEVQVGAVCES